MRAFLAFPLDDENKTAIRPVIEEGRKKFPDIKWVKPENLHMTLLFLGNIDDETETWVREICSEAVGKHRAFDVQYEGLSQFPPKGKARVIFSPLIEGGRECTAIYNDLYPIFQERFSLRGNRYSPHITLGRVRKGKKHRSLQESDFTQKLKGNYRIDRIIFYQSVLQSGGPVYNEITSFVLQS